MFEPIRSARVWVAVSLTGLIAGCSLVPGTRMDECHLRCQALQSETARLKDQALSLRNQNRDLTQRALDDAHRVRALEESQVRLERSLAKYQEERDTLVEAFEQLQRQVQLAAESPPMTRAAAADPDRP